MKRGWLLLLAALAGGARADLIDELGDLTRAGDYQAAIELGTPALDAEAGNDRLLLELGKLAMLTGDYPAAAQYLDRAIALDGEALLSARYQRGELHRAQGETAAAEGQYRLLREVWLSGRRLQARDLFAIARATHRLAAADPQLYREAVQFFDEAARRDPADLEPKIALAELLLEKYNNPEALEVLGEVFERDERHPLALLALARSHRFDFSPEAMTRVDEALELNPNLVPARVLRGRLLLELEDYSGAHEAADRALAVNPRALDALALKALVHFLRNQHDEFDRIERRVLDFNPRYAEFYNSLAESAVMNRLYREAAEFAARALELDAGSWRGYGLLGMNQLRLGEMEAGRANLERAFAGDPFNVWIRNTLQLADNLADFTTIRSGPFDIVLHRDEAALLAPLVEQVAERAWRELTARYRHQPEVPVRIELYPDHADFSVRTVGLAGVGLLGVCFGPVVAMDSPAAREQGAFNWASTLWHEIAHVFHLSMTANRVPRWFTEGLAVHEERRAGRGWGMDVDPGFLQAYREGRILPLSQLNDGFVRPTYPEQIGHSYFQASLIFEFIERRWGFDVVLDMLEAYGDTREPERVLTETLAIDSAALDAAFDAFLADEYAVALAALGGDDSPPAVAGDMALPGNYAAQLDLGRLLLEENEYDAAEIALKRAQALFPQYAGGDSAYWLLAVLYTRTDRQALALEQLEAMTAINGEHYEARLELAELRAARGDEPGAIAALEAALDIFPYDIELHQRLADHYGGQQRWADAVRARQGALALDPADRAEAYFQLALAEQRAGNPSAARRQVVYALEIAPNYFPAQRLLLSLVDTPPAEGDSNGQPQ